MARFLLTVRPRVCVFFSPRVCVCFKALDMEGTQLKKMAAYRAELDAERESMLARV